jgi:hypothetical protein
MRILEKARSRRALALLALCAGCGGSTVSTMQVAETEAAIRAADELGAEQRPRAALHLKLARDHMNAARSAIEHGEGDEASLLLERADADAELALVLARQARHRADARRASERADELERRVERRAEGE